MTGLLQDMVGCLIRADAIEVAEADHERDLPIEARRVPDYGEDTLLTTQDRRLLWLEEYRLHREALENA